MVNKRSLPDEFRNKAEEIAMFPYSVDVSKITEEDGDVYYLAVNPELEGCMAHGETPEEAKENLKEARADYIQILLLDGSIVPVPSVATKEFFTMQTGTVQIENVYDVQQNTHSEKLIARQDLDKNVVGEYEYSFSLLSNA